MEPRTGYGRRVGLGVDAVLVSLAPNDHSGPIWWLSIKVGGSGTPEMGHEEAPRGCQHSSQCVGSSGPPSHATFCSSAVAEVPNGLTFPPSP